MVCLAKPTYTFRQNLSFFTCFCYISWIADYFLLYKFATYIAIEICAFCVMRWCYWETHYEPHLFMKVVMKVWFIFKFAAVQSANLYCENIYFLHQLNCWLFPLINVGYIFCYRNHCSFCVMHAMMLLWNPLWRSFIYETHYEGYIHYQVLLQCRVPVFISKRFISWSIEEITSMCLKEVVISHKDSYRIFWMREWSFECIYLCGCVKARQKIRKYLRVCD